MRIYNALKGKITLTLNKGSLHLKASYKQASQEWDIDNVTNVLDFDFTDANSESYNWDPVNFQFTNLIDMETSYYSFRVHVDDNPKVNAYALKAGISSYLFFNKGEEQCVKGVFLKQFEHIELTVDKSD